VLFFFSSRRRHTRCLSDWSSDVCSSDLRRRLAVGTTRADAPIQIWDGVAGMPIAILEGHEHVVHALAFDSNGSRLASGGEDRVEIGRASCRERGEMWGVDVGGEAMGEGI